MSNPCRHARRTLQAVVILALAVLGPQCPPLASAQTPAAQAILHQTAELYRTLTTYRFAATATVRVETVDSGLHASAMAATPPLRIALAATPGKLWLEHKDRDLDIVYVNDGATAWTYIPTRRKYSRESGAFLVQPGERDDLASSDPILFTVDTLVGRFRYLDDRDGNAVVERAEPVRVGAQRILCWVIAVRDPAGHKQEELWVDQSRFLVLRDTAAHAGHDGLHAVIELGGVDWTEADIATPPPASLFTFTPPAQASLTEPSQLEAVAHVPLAGSPAPDFALRNLDGATVSLDSLRGKVVVLDFWATWCPSCRDQAPILDAIARSLGNSGVAVIGIDDESAGPVRDFVQQHRLSYPTLLDPHDRTITAYGVYEIPHLIVIDSSGRIADDLVAPSEDTIRAAIARAQSRR